MRHLRGVTAAVLSLGALACGMAPGSVTPAGKVAIQASKRQDASIVRIGYLDAAGLQRLSRFGVDLFEDVDDSTRTVGARVTRAEAFQLRQAGYTLRFVQDVVGSPGFPEGYHRVDAINDRLRELNRAYPDLVRLKVLGQSLEGRDILAVQFGTPGRGKPRILFYAGEHARELPPVEVQLRLIEHLASRYGKDALVTHLVADREIWVLPLMNPDGRVRVEAGDAMWRKNARLNADGSVGVDINRNYDNHWKGGNPQPSDEDYHGAAPESEPETRLLKRFMSEQRFTMAVNMHCFAGMILWPPGYDKSFSPREALLGRVGHAIGNRLAYKAGTIARTIYQITGDSATWAMEALGTLTYIVELNDPGFSPSYKRVESDWDEWRWPLMWMALVSAAPGEAETTLPPEPTTPANWPSFQI